MAKTDCNNGNGKDVRKLRFPVTFVWVIVLAVAGTAIACTGMIARAQSAADRANTRVDSIEQRLENIENKQDRTLEILLKR